MGKWLAGLNDGELMFAAFVGSLIILAIYLCIAAASRA